MTAVCPLCETRDAPSLWRDARLRVISAVEPDYPAFVRVVWHAHIREMTDLSPGEREHCMLVVWAVEQVLRDTLKPDKINIASLGNQVPHLHWHVLPRFADDAHFPDPVWATRRRAGVSHPFDTGQFAEQLTRMLGV